MRRTVRETGAAGGARAAESERRFRSLVHNSSEVIKIVDLDGTLRYASHLDAESRAKLSGRLGAKPGYRRFLRTTKTGLLRIDRAAVAAEAKLDCKVLLRTPTPPSPRPTSRWATSSCSRSSAAGAT